MGPTVNATEISDVWGVNSSMEILDGPVPEKNSDLNSTVRTLIQSISANRGRQLKQYIVRVGHPDAKVLEAKLRRLLVRNMRYLNIYYVEFFHELFIYGQYKEIGTNKLLNKKSQKLSNADY